MEHAELCMALILTNTKSYHPPPPAPSQDTTVMKREQTVIDGGEGGRYCTVGTVTIQV